ncbi:MAG: DUF58 domain-containing protein [Coriobacteriia bacterium]|nr:DUF58 domain-containing protein [Coriobacteriia bacterium]
MGLPNLTDLRNKYGKAERKRAQRSHELKGVRREQRTRVLKACACVGLVLMCAFLAVMVGNSNYQATAIGWIPLVSVVTAIGLAFAYLQVIKRSLVVEERSNLADCQRDRDVEFTVHFKNTTPLFLFRVEAHFFISDLYGNSASQAMTTLSLTPFEEYELRFAAKFEHIGTYEAGLKRVVVSDFLNLFTYSMENTAHQQVNVTPKLQRVEQVTLSNEALLESASAAKTILADSMDYAYVREYVPGDPLKTIHWKLSARSDGYMTRLYEMPTNPAVGIVMDFYAPAEDPAVLMGLFDAVVESAFSMSEYARRSAMEMQLTYKNREGEEARVVSWKQEDLPELIADIPPMSNDPAHKLDAVNLINGMTMVAHGQNNLIICTANLSSELVSAVVSAKMRRRHPVVVAVVPSDLVGKERTDYCKNLVQLDAANIGYVMISKSDELAGVSA